MLCQLQAEVDELGLEGSGVLVGELEVEGALCGLTKQLLHLIQAFHLLVGWHDTVWSWISWVELRRMIVLVSSLPSVSSVLPLIALFQGYAYLYTVPSYKESMAKQYDI